MAAEDTSQVVMVPVKRYDVNLTLEDLLTPLAEAASQQPQPGPGGAVAHAVTPSNPELAQHMQTLSQLASQLKDVVSKINQIDPTVLAPKPSQPPKA